MLDVFIIVLHMSYGDLQKKCVHSDAARQGLEVAACATMPTEPLGFCRIYLPEKDKAIWETGYTYEHIYAHETCHCETWRETVHEGISHGPKFRACLQKKIGKPY
jgi:hypothetical protein